MGSRSDPAAGATGRGAPSRRSLIQALGVTVMPSVARAQPPAADHGRVNPPVPAPPVSLLRHDGVSSSLPALAKHHATALQLMFTACTTTCPIQGAIFARVQKLIPDQVARGIQLISLTVDPRNDTPEVLTRWLRRFQARPGWISAASHPKDVDTIKAFAGGRNSPLDNHSTQVQILNRDGGLIWRTGDLPEAEEIAALLKRA
ncbi:MAG: SCO family protein [Bacteroidota bacterium]